MLGAVQPQGLFLPAAARAERWGRRTVGTVLGALLLVDVLVSAAAAFDGVVRGPASPAPTWALGAIVLDVAVLLLIRNFAGPQWRCFAAALLSLVVSALYLRANVLSGGGLAEQAGLAVLLMTAVRSLRRWHLWCAGPLLAAAMVLEPLRWGAVGRLFVFPVLLLAGVVFAAGLHLRALDERRMRAVADVRRGERLQLARELHDLVAHHVTGIVVGVQAAQVAAASHPRQALEVLPEIEAAGMETLASMRRLVAVMRDDDGPASAARVDGGALQDLVAEFSVTGPPVRLRTDDAIDRSAPEVAVSAHRIVQEALTNVRRHAVGVTAIDVEVRGTSEGLLVAVRNDGSRIEAGATPLGGAGGFGLLGISERVTAVGGRLAAGPHPDGGWLVTAMLPAGAR
jgi:signal transduction histidine kinase